MKKTTLKNKLYLLIGIMMFALFCLIILSTSFMNNLKNSSIDLIEKLYPSLMTASNINKQVIDYREYQYRYIKSQDNNLKIVLENRMDSILSEIDKSLIQYEEYIDEKDKENFEKTKKLWITYLTNYATITEISNAGDIDKAIFMYTTDAEVLYNSFTENFNQIVSNHKNNIYLSTLEIEEKYNRLILYHIIIGFIIIILAFISISYIAKSIKKPIYKLLAATKQMAQGNLSIQLDCSSNDEIADLSLSSKKLMNKLKNIINDEKYFLQELTNSNFQVTSTCEDEYIGDFKPIIKSLYTLKQNLEVASKTEYQALLFQVLSQNVDIVFMIYDLINSNMEYVFTNAKRVLGISSDVLIANPLEFFSICDKDLYEHIFDLIVNKKIVTKFNREINFINPMTNEKKWLNIVLTPVQNNDKVTKYIIAIEDLTESQKNNHALKDALLNAQNANVAKSYFFSCISHEIRTPLNAITGLTTIALTNLDNQQKVEDCLNKITFSSNHLLMLINDVLDMAKIESGKLTLNNETFNLDDILNEISTISSPQIKLKQQKFKIIYKNISYNLLTGDALRLTQILLNIVSNAIKFTPPEGSITISVKQYSINENNIKVQFTIYDTGYGMSPEFLDKIFDPFEQEENTSSRKTIGSGLGMPIVKNLVSLMNGSIRVKSELNKGSIFVVTLPFSIVANEKNFFKGKKFKDLNILVIDADMNSLYHTVNVLERLNVSADSTTMGKEGLNKITLANSEKNFYDIIFIDLQLLDTNVISIIQIIKEISYHSLIIVTDNEKTSNEYTALKVGANAFLLKPIHQSDVYNTLISINSNKTAKISNIKNSRKLSDCRILIAEDNELNLEIAIELLKQTGASIESATDGREAVMMYESKPEGYYQLIIMDIQMPHLNGHEATIKIRNSSRRDAKTIPIVAMTANAYIEDVNAALSAGMNNHISKPIDIHLLFEIIYKELKRSLIN